MDAELQALVDKGKKTQAEVDSMIQLASEVQYRILTKQLRPGMWVRLTTDLLAHKYTSHADVLQPNCVPAPRRSPCTDIARYGTHHGS
jgi:hypothetical protein